MDAPGNPNNSMPTNTDKTLKKNSIKDYLPSGRTICYIIGATGVGLLVGYCYKNSINPVDKASEITSGIITALFGAAGGGAGSSNPNSESRTPIHQRSNLESKPQIEATHDIQPQLQLETQTNAIAPCSNQETQVDTIQKPDTVTHCH